MDTIQISKEVKNGISIRHTYPRAKNQQAHPPVVHILTDMGTDPAGWDAFGTRLAKENMHTVATCLPGFVRGKREDREGSADPLAVVMAIYKVEAEIRKQIPDCKIIQLPFSMGCLAALDALMVRELQESHTKNLNYLQRIQKWRIAKALTHHGMQSPPPHPNGTLYCGAVRGNSMLPGTGEAIKENWKATLRVMMDGNIKRFASAPCIRELFFGKENDANALRDKCMPNIDHVSTGLCAHYCFPRHSYWGFPEHHPSFSSPAYCIDSVGDPFGGIDPVLHHRKHELKIINGNDNHQSPPHMAFIHSDDLHSKVIDGIRWILTYQNVQSEEKDV